MQRSNVEVELPISRLQRDRYRCGEFRKQKEELPIFAEDVWYCTQCGVKHTKGKFCTKCGAERSKKIKAKLELLLDKYLDIELYTEPEIFCRKYSDQIDCTMR